MSTTEKEGARARGRTDTSLSSERRKTDEALKRTHGQTEQRADRVAEQARQRADATLDSARAETEAKLASTGASVEVLAVTKDQQATEGTALDAERRTADILLASERQQRERAVTSLLHAERSRTDKHLLIERALFDERLARILAELRESLRLRDEFVSVASHELKTPLTPLSLRLQNLAMEVAQEPASPFASRVQKYIETAQRQVSRLSALSADLLDVSRIATGKLTVDLERVDLGALVRDMTDQFRPNVEKAGSTLEVDAPSVTGQWDPFLLERALSTLLDNAIKYGLGKSIRVRLQVNAEHVRLTVEDHGIGIASHDLARIFGRFERAVSGRSYSGLGLGLYTCRTILDAMGGAIAVESELGRGAKFIVDLPRRHRLTRRLMPPTFVSSSGLGGVLQLEILHSRASLNTGAWRC